MYTHLLEQLKGTIGLTPGQCEYALTFVLAYLANEQEIETAAGWPLIELAFAEAVKAAKEYRS